MDKRLAILGGCGGIGRELVVEAQSNGWSPIVFDLPQSIAAHRLDGIEMHEVDASDPDAVERAAQNLTEPVQGFVNLCGFMSEAGPLTEQTPQTWMEVMNGNLNAAFFAARAFLTRIGEGGSVVHVGSGLGHNARPGYGPYAVAKAGISAMTRQLALESAPRIRVNCVAPSAVDTAFLRGGTGRSDAQAPVSLDMEAYAAAIPMRRVAVPGDVTGPILFLLSDAARYITGQVLHVNGGAFMP